ncbi:RHS repeat-associated core domain-containing protein [Kangiella sp. TOML190]|uniref:RHS repeat-associated core domain-containing protein n=1 Tax=Kangiella sp. TOML190 TaxID=2931351 RepID=UPI00203A6931|nr:RHS repeat-associated core domain-containing protein [Kangiella sp. TOML190]
MKKLMASLVIMSSLFLSAIVHAAVPGQVQNLELDTEFESTFVLIHTDVSFLVPVNARDENGSLTASWDPISEASEYQYRICQGGSCGDWVAVNSNSAQIDFPLSGNYILEVRACNNDGCGASTTSEVIEITGWQSASLPEPAPVAHVEPIPSVNLTELINSDAVGAIAGEFRVNESGQATYNIPIFTPTGRAGVAPQVALSYSSQGGKGILGLGWNLSAGSAISRCRQTAELDGQDLPVSLSLDDRFCLDGQRLILQSGTYGANGSKYRTELASQTRVTALGSAGNGPEYFKVERKDGSVSYYGNSENSRLYANRVNSISGSTVNTSVLPTVLTWAQHEFIDNPYLDHPNKITYHYQKNDNYGEQYLDSISYAPNNSIEFIYSNRPFINSGMGAGGYHKIGKFLEEILVKDSGNDVRKYELAYKQKEVTIYDEIDDGVFGNPVATYNTNDYPLRIVSITESGKNKNNNWVSKTPKVFDWLDSISGYEEADNYTTLNNSYWGYTSGDKIYDGNYQVADVNGDNKQDIVYASKYGSRGVKFNIALSKGTNADVAGGSFHSQSCVVNIGDQYPKRKDFTWSMIDYNADGRSDLYTTDYVSNDNYEIKVFLGQTNGCFSTTSVVSGIFTDDHETAKPVDYTGDGLPDLIAGNDVYIMEREGNNASLPYSWTNKYSLSYINFPSTPGFDAQGHWYSVEYDLNKLNVADFDGDGRADILVTRIVTQHCESEAFPSCTITEPVNKQDYIALSKGNGEFSNSNRVIATYNVKLDDDDNPIRQFMDINGDGLADYLYKNKNDKYWYYLLNTGRNFTGSQKLVALGTDDAPSFTDYNHDGRIDITFSRSRDLHVIAALETGFSSSATNTGIDAGGNLHSSIFVDVNGDGIQEHVRVDMDGTHTLRVDKPKHDNSKHRYVISEIDNGMGNKTSISYQPLTTAGLYTKSTGSAMLNWGAGTGCSGTSKSSMAKCSPVFDMNGPMYVVSQVNSSSPHKASPSSTVGVSYRYGEARMQAKGRGFLGFEWLETKDLQTNIITKTEYRQDYPFIGSPKKTTTTYNGQLLSEAVNQWSFKLIGSGASKIRFPYISESSEASWDLRTLGGTKFNSQTFTKNQYDDYANLTDMTVLTRGSYQSPTSAFPYIDSMTGVSKKVTSNNYQDNVSRWHLGRLTSSQVIHSRVGSTVSITRNSTFEYDPYTGMLVKEIIEPNGDDKEYLKTIHKYDGYGNKTLKRTCSKLVGNCDNSTEVVDGDAYHINRWSQTVYDDQGRYPIKTLNAFGQVTSEILDRNNLGQPTKVESLSGEVVDTVYGAFGAKYFTRSKSGAWSRTTKTKCGGVYSCPSPAVYFVKSWAAGGSLSYTYFDALGREIQKAGRSFNGDFSVTSTEYNQRGLAISATEPVLQEHPYSVPNTTHVTSSEYDVLGRPWRVTNPDGGVTSITFNGLTTTTNNPLGQNKTEVKDASGKTVSVTDNLNGVLSYDYDATGNLLELKFNGVKQSSMTYDTLGRKKTMWDADKGGANNKLWVYDYNALGELVEQTDAKGQKIQTWSDRLGRPIKRLSLTTGGATESHQVWAYDNGVGSGYSKGQLVREHDLTSGYKVEPSYDHLGRLSLSESWIDGQYFFAETVYDQYGRVFQSFDAAGSEFSNAGVRNVYNQFGFLEKVRDARNGVNGKVYKTIVAMDARGNVTHELSGNGVETIRSYFPKTGRLSDIESYKGGNKVQDLEYKWDLLGNLEYRKELDPVSNQLLHESFQYDGLNRLLNANHPNETMVLTYDANGNINSKTGVGSYSYGEAQCGVKAGPHAVTSTSVGNKSYCYDYNGNMVSDSSGSQQTRQMQYSSFDKLTQVTKDGHTTRFSYAPSRSRYKRVDIKGSKTTTSYYVGNVEVIKTSNESFTTYRRNLGGLIIDEKTNGVKTTSYLHTDHLGSTDVITDSTGNIEQEFSFNAFGARRDARDWQTYAQDEWAMALSPADDQAKTSKGFTGHEQMDETGLIHMNGRVYDPTLGRFIQADPHIQAPSDSQSLNRYSYVKNNPLSYTDPTGYFFKKLIKKIKQFATVIVGAILAVYCQVCFASFWASVGTGAALGGFGAAVNGGNILKGALMGAFSAAAFFGVGEFFGHQTVSFGSVVSHGVVGGVMNVLQGGKFGHGFLSAGFTKGFSKQIGTIKTIGGRAIAAAIVGGTASKLGGGKFANGAVAGAFSRLFNDEFQREKVKEVKTAAPGESEEMFIDALGDELDRLTEENQVEYCANICKREGSDGNDYFSAEIMTDNDPLSCGVATNSCADGYSPAKKAIHSHPKRFRITRELRRKYPEHGWSARTRTGSADHNSFSTTDQSFVDQTGYDLYLSGGSDQDNLILRANGN